MTESGSAPQVEAKTTQQDDLSWSYETVRMINELTPDIKGKAFDPDWFLLFNRFTEYERAFQKAAAGVTPTPATPTVAELEKEWMAQTEWNSFTNWLVNVKIPLLTRSTPATETLRESIGNILGLLNEANSQRMYGTEMDACITRAIKIARDALAAAPGSTSVTDAERYKQALHSIWAASDDPCAVDVAAKVLGYESGGSTSVAGQCETCGGTKENRLNVEVGSGKGGCLCSAEFHGPIGTSVAGQGTPQCAGCADGMPTRSRFGELWHIYEGEHAYGRRCTAN
jgi:hypothetical protein